MYHLPPSSVPHPAGSGIVACICGVGFRGGIACERCFEDVQPGDPPEAEQDELRTLFFGNSVNFLANAFSVLTAQRASAPRIEANYRREATA